jgi:hypothetical protein
MPATHCTINKLNHVHPYNWQLDSFDSPIVVYMSRISTIFMAKKKDYKTLIMYNVSKRWETCSQGISDTMVKGRYFCFACDPEQLLLITSMSNNSKKSVHLLC